MEQALTNYISNALLPPEEVDRFAQDVRLYALRKCLLFPRLGWQRDLQHMAVMQEALQIMLALSW